MAQIENFLGIPMEKIFTSIVDSIKSIFSGAIHSHKRDHQCNSKYTFRGTPDRGDAAHKSDNRNKNRTYRSNSTAYDLYCSVPGKADRKFTS